MGLARHLAAAEGVPGEMNASRIRGRGQVPLFPRQDVGGFASAARSAKGHTMTAKKLRHLQCRWESQSLNFQSSLIMEGDPFAVLKGRRLMPGHRSRARIIYLRAEYPLGRSAGSRH